MATTTEAIPAPMPDVHLIDNDGVPMESTWHRDAMNFLIEQVRYHRRDYRDYFVGGNMFIYFSEEQARNRDFRGPDFFYVRGVRYDPFRPYYAVWQENGRYPDVIVELLSESTKLFDRTIKKGVYETTFRTPEYFLYDPDIRTLEGFRHNGTEYQRIEPDARGFLWSKELQLWLGTWTGPYQGNENLWLRFFDKDGNAVPLFAESEGQRAEAERQRAEAERQRAEAAEVEIARLKAMLGDRPAS
jgi:Uma2 family endonuclease